MQRQTYPCKHYIFVEGEERQAAADRILQKFANLTVTYLPLSAETDSSINTITLFLVEEELVCYLDEQNWLAPDHLEKCVNALLKSQADYAYSLRNFHTLEGEFLCEDALHSLGEGEHIVLESVKCPYEVGELVGELEFVAPSEHYLDSNSCLLRNATARALCPHWQKEDKNLYPKLLEAGLKGVSSQAATLHTLFDAAQFYPNAFAQLLAEPFLLSLEEAYEFANDVMLFQTEEATK